MAVTRARILITFFTLAGMLTPRVQAKYWLNQLENYDSLPVCAEGPISQIVRNMVAGCGDGGRATSYDCFCTESSEEFRDIIATSVSKQCKHTGPEVASATSLFHEYCQLGKNAGDDAVDSKTEATSK